MKIEEVLKAVKEVREKAKKRNFVQSFDLIISLKDVNLKKPEEQIDLVLNLPHGKGKKPKVVCFAGKELEVQAKKLCDLVITKEEISGYMGKNREIRKLCNNYDFFICQVNMMPQVAQVFGKFLSVRGKMPDPKIGLVVPPNADLKALIEKLQSLIRVQAKKQPVISCSIGNEKMSDEEIAKNLLFVYENVRKKLPSGEHQIKNVRLKLTMGSPVKIGK